MLGFTKFKINRLVNRRELYSNFSYNKWNQLDTGSKWKCLQQLENHFAAEQGRPAVKVLPISSKEVRGDYGGYDPDKNVIYINRDLVEYGTLVGPVDINHLHSLTLICSYLIPLHMKDIMHIRVMQ